MPNLEIDGLRLRCDEGQTVLDVCLDNKIYIPTLCYHPRLRKRGSCRICLVEVEGLPVLQPACHTPARERMVIHTASRQVIRARKAIVEFLLASGGHDCPVCEANENCELHEAARRLGIETTSYSDHAPVPEPIDDSHPMIRFDPNKCVACWRCIEGCNELAVNEVLHFSGRRGGPPISFVPSPLLADSDCLACGECVQLCPTGALIEKKWNGDSPRSELACVQTTCPYCGVGCQVDVHVDHGSNQIVGVTGREGVPPNEGMLCVKGRFGYDFVSSPKRLKEPLVRKNGRLEAVSWEYALDHTAERLREIHKASGPDAISGLACARDTNENNYAMMKFMRAVVGTNNIDHCART